MRLVSWNVNGLRACVTKGFADTFRALDADIFCLQETKLQPGQIALDLPGYHQYWCSAEKKGYSGTAVFTKAEPLDVQYNLGLPQHDLEGRVITAEYPEFYLVCVYTPNAHDGLRRLDSFIKSLPTVRRVEILPYHTLGLFKWQNLGIPYPLDGVRVPTAEEVAAAEALLHVKDYPDAPKE